MRRLALMIYSVISFTLAGVGVVVALVTGHTDLLVLMTSAVIGAVAAAPLSWFVARALYDA